MLFSKSQKPGVWLGRAGLAMASVVMAACGPKPLAPLVDHPLDAPRPDIEQDGVFRLEGAGVGRQSFGGNIAFLSPSVTAEQVRALSETSRRLREWNVERVKDHLAWQSLVAQVGQWQAAAGRPPDEEKILAWVRGQTAALAKKGLASEGDVIRDFGYYCQAKIVELATDPLFLRRSYRERPSPFIGCEDYYAENLYFSGSACEPSPAGRDYFACLWNDGVLKTGFAPRFKNLAGLTRLVTEFPAAFKAWLLCQEGAPTATCSLSKSLRFRQAALGMSALRVPMIPRGAVIEDVPLQDLFTDREAGGGAVNPLRVINSFQNTERDDILLGYLVPARDYTLAMALLAERFNGSPAEQDLFFHQPLTPLPASTHSTLPLTEKKMAILAKMDSSLTAKAGELAKAQALLLAAERRADGSDPDGGDAHFLQEVHQAAVLANEPGLGQAFMFSRFQMDRAGAGLLLQVYFDDSKIAHYACLQMPQGKMIECDEAMLAKRDLSATMIPMDRAVYDPVTSGLNLGWPLPDLATSGLAFKARHPEDPSPFSDFPPAAIVGQRIRLVLYPRPLHDGVSMATGEVFLESPTGQLMGEGAASYFETTPLDAAPPP